MLDLEAMAVALEEAELARRQGDVPVGAVVLRGAELVARAHNERERRADPSAHAEVLALGAASSRLGRAILAGCTLVVTLEPCLMCAGAALVSGVDRVVFGAWDEKAGACGSRYNVLADPRLGRPIPVVGGLEASRAGALLLDFFAARRGAPDRG